MQLTDATLADSYACVMHLNTRRGCCGTRQASMGSTEDIHERFNTI